MRNLFLAPILIFVIIYIYIQYFESNRFMKFRDKKLRSLKKKGVKSSFVDFIYSVFTPKPDSKTYNRYVHLLRYSNYSVKNFFVFKVAILMLAVSFALLIHATNIKIYESKIFNSYEYKVDLIFQDSNESVDRKKALKEEIDYLKTILKEVDKEKFFTLDKESLQSSIYNIISSDDIKTELSKHTLANKLYHRLKDYYLIRKIRYIPILIILVVIFYIPDVFILFKNLFIKNDRRRELKFLKKLIILNGSIKPTSFLEVLTIMIDKSYFYTELLRKIEKLNHKNSVDRKGMYSEIIKSTKDLNEKLFLEKLEQANNNNFEFAISNIEKDFRIEKRQDARKVKKIIQNIDITGLAGALMIIFLLTLYLLMPWLDSYNLNEIL
ncbi:hypothetical protein R9X47_00860 [Wukongibacter baidiensis]|uniref:hypothetical protein n=1 Tax=Wukongibacter baidiensis TaxID=1723361 RepID=UPI003D7F59D9